MPRATSALTQATHRFGLKPKDPPSNMQPLFQIPLVMSVLGRFFSEATDAVFQYNRKTFYFYEEAARISVCLAAKGSGQISCDCSQENLM